MRNIEIQTILKESEYIKVNRHIILSKTSTKILLGIMPIIFLFGIITFDISNIALSLFFLLFPILFPCFLFITPIFNIKKEFKNSNKLNQKIQWIITQDGFTILTKDIKEIWTWKEFYRVKIFHNIIILFLKSPKNFVKFIPKRGFQNSEDYEYTIQLCKSKINV